MPPGSAELAIDVAHLAKSYGELVAVADLSLSIAHGETFGFLGKNGAGKTTSVKMLLGLTRATSGNGALLGKPLGDRGARAKVGYLPELFRYHDWMSAREELVFHAGLAGVPHVDRERRIAEVLDLVGLAKRANDPIGTYSKGMQQRVGIAVAVLAMPDLVFLDEPTSALDPVGRRDVREMVRALKERGVTVFLNSHLLSEVEQMCDRVAIVDRGRIVASGTLAEVIGGAVGMRVRLGESSEGAMRILQSYGTVSISGEWHVVTGAGPDVVPALIRELATAGVAIYAVEPLKATLEERFMEVMHA
ncbi:MAG: ABC transporter ATP-binding protein [Candidatus Eremiobacteraeota bacterium]|nr:ABC transporter ATP-binding protein [Candidatus Eremiobacteraeota bacterium]